MKGNSILPETDPHYFTSEKVLNYEMMYRYDVACPIQAGGPTLPELGKKPKQLHTDLPRLP